jgi:PAS domain S-box-containing protein
MGVVRLLGRTSVKLALGITLTIGCVLALGLFVLMRRHENQLLQIWRDSARDQSNLVRVALEHQMLENERSLIRKMVASLALMPDVSRIMILNHRGQVSFTSDPRFAGEVFSQDSHACAPCHRTAAPQRENAIVLELYSERVLRSVEPIRNAPQCHGCHDPARRINGVLILDLSIGGMESRLRRDLFWMSAGTGAVAFLLLTGIGLIMRRMIFTRLARFATAARAFAQGDLDSRIEIRGNDRLSMLAREFNEMADSVARLVNDVQRHRQRLINVMNSVDDGMIVVDRDLKLIALNRSFATRFQRTREELVNRPYQELVAELTGDVENAPDPPARKCFSSRKLETATYYITSEEGRERVEEVYASPILDDAGDVEYVVEIWRDITERRREEARLAEFHRLASVGMLAAGFSHEMNTPLGTMLTYIDAIIHQLESAPPLPNETTAELLQDARMIRAEILRCRSVTQRFLKFSRKQDLRLEFVDTRQAIEASVQLVAAMARAGGVTVDIAPEMPTATVFANEGALQQVLLNLLLNAIQVSPRGARVTVDTAIDDHAVRIRVTDQGPGIPEEDQRRIFEPFFSRRSEGTGLGLFLSRSMANIWRGDVVVHSRPGQGATFEILFPQEEDEST